MDTNGVTIPVQEYVELSVGHERALRLRSEADSLRALTEAKAEIDRRLHEMNQWRSQLTDERTQYVPRDWFEKVHATLEDRTRVLEGFKENINGRIIALGGILVLMQVAIFALTAWWTKK